jgi:hypothetical protein
VAAKNGLHVLFEGNSGSGLTTLARFVSLMLLKEKNNDERDLFQHRDLGTLRFPQVLLSNDSTVEDLIGVFKPLISSEKYVCGVFIVE